MEYINKKVVTVVFVGGDMQETVFDTMQEATNYYQSLDDLYGKTISVKGISDMVVKNVGEILETKLGTLRNTDIEPGNLGGVLFNDKEMLENLDDNPSKEF